MHNCFMGNLELFAGINLNKKAVLLVLLKSKGSGETGEKLKITLIFEKKSFEYGIFEKHCEITPIENLMTRKKSRSR